MTADAQYAPEARMQHTQRRQRRARTMHRKAAYRRRPGPEQSTAPAVTAPTWRSTADAEGQPKVEAHLGTPTPHCSEQWKRTDWSAQRRIGSFPNRQWILSGSVRLLLAARWKGQAGHADGLFWPAFCKKAGGDGGSLPSGCHDPWGAEGAAMPAVPAATALV
jgi:hypothetical protein